MFGKAADFDFGGGSALRFRGMERGHLSCGIVLKLSICAFLAYKNVRIKTAHVHRSKPRIAAATFNFVTAPLQLRC